jgi:hypothetical protein
VTPTTHPRNTVQELSLCQGSDAEMTLRISRSTAASCSFSTRRCALINVRLGCAISPVRFGGHDLDQLKMAGDQSGEFAGGRQAMVAAPAASSRQSAPALPHPYRQSAACQSKSPSRLRAGFSGTLPGSRRFASTSPSVRLKGTMPKAWRMTGCAPRNEQCVCLSSEGSVQRNDT